MITNFSKSHGKEGPGSRFQKVVDDGSTGSSVDLTGHFSHLEEVFHTREATLSQSFLKNLLISGLGNRSPCSPSEAFLEP